MIAPINAPRANRSQLRDDDPGKIDVAVREYTVRPADKPSGGLSRMVGKYPVAATLTAATAGLVLGWFVKRKWNG